MANSGIKEVTCPHCGGEVEIEYWYCPGDRDTPTSDYCESCPVCGYQFELDARQELIDNHDAHLEASAEQEME